MGTPTGSRGRFAGVCVCIAVLWCVLSWPWLSGDVTIPYDAKAHFQAQLQFLANALHRGESPFWAPHVFAGSPQIADPQSLIFSPAILLAWFSPAPGFRLMDGYTLALLLVGGLGVAAHGRELGWTRLAQVVAALVFIFGASSAWRLQHVGQVQSLACFAVAWWLLDRALRRGSWVAGAGAGLAAGVMLATPDQISFLGAWLLAGMVAWRWCGLWADAKALRRTVAPLACGAAVGLAAVMAPLLMALMFSQASSREAIDFTEAGRGSLHPAFLLTAIIGDLFGAADPKVDFWGPSSASWSPGLLTLSQNMGQVYVGLAPLMAAVALILRGWRELSGEARLAFAALAAMTLYALGWNTPAFAALFDWAPGVSLFRRPADATFLIGFCLALLAGHALTALARLPLRRAEIAALVLLLAAALALGASVGAAHGRLHVAAAPIAAAALIGALSLLALMTVGRPGAVGPSGWRAGAGAMALLVVLAADLRWHNGPNESNALPPAAYAELDPATANPTIRLVKSLLVGASGESGRRDRVEFVGMRFHWPNLGLVHGFDHALGYNPLHLADFTEATGAKDHMGESGERAFTPLMPSFRSRFADLLGLRFVISRLPIERVDPRLKAGDLKLVAATADGYIYENARALPRAMVVGRVGIADFAEVLDKGLPAEFDPTCSALVESWPEDVALPAGSPGGGRVRQMRYGNTEVSIEAEASAPSLLLLNDVWHPWWTATVNGEDVEIIKANVLFRAVPIPAGASRVVFRFRPLEGLVAELRERFIEAEPEPGQMAMTP
jgi:hypothetical protein